MTNALAWYLSLHWMLTTDPSALTLRALLPMLTFCLVASVSVTAVIVTGLEALARRLERR